MHKLVCEQIYHCCLPILYFAHGNVSDRCDNRPPKFVLRCTKPLGPVGRFKLRSLCVPYAERAYHTSGTLLIVLPFLGSPSTGGPMLALFSFFLCSSRFPH